METSSDLVQTLTLIQPVLVKRELAVPAPRLRFHKKGPKATAPTTERMRAIKDTLRLTTRQLVLALNAYEHEQLKAGDKRAAGFASDDTTWQPMTPVVLSSYLQGFVLQDHFINQVLLRLENYLHFAQQHLDPNHLGQKDIRQLMDQWFEQLHIHSKDKFRPFAKLIAPYHRRPVQAKLAGIISFGAVQGPVRRFQITEQVTGPDRLPVVTHGVVDLIHALLVKEGQWVSPGQEIQYGIHYQTSKDPLTQSSRAHENGLVYLDKPIEDHTAFFRWYKTRTGPRSIKTLEYVQKAVDQAVAHLSAKEMSISRSDPAP